MDFKTGTNPCHPEGRARRISKENAQEILHFVQNDKKCAFTLAEVLITLGIIGIVAAMTLLVLKDARDKGYVTGLKKAYSVLSNATNLIISEEGEPSNWGFTKVGAIDNSGNERIVSLYKKHLAVLNSGGYCSSCNELMPGVPRLTYKSLNGVSRGNGLYGRPLFVDSYPLLLQDGSIIGISFKNIRNAVFWGTPDISFTVDVNGLKGPNRIGRDVFFLYINAKTGKFLPYANETFNSGNVDYRDTCDKDKEGYSCAYRVITEGKMNY